jgi:hypothetical protein
MPDTEIFIDGDIGWSGFQSRPDPLTLPAGMAALAQNMRFVRGRAEVRKGIKRLADSISPASAPVEVPFQLGADVAVTSITRASTTATVTTTAAHGYTTGDQVNISGAAQSAYNGDFSITVTGTTTFTYTVAGSPATPATGTILANKGPVIRDAYTGGIFAACVFSSPSSSVTLNGAEWIVLFGADRAYLFRDGQSVVTKTYPSPDVIEEADDIEVLQCFDRLVLFRSRDISGSYARKSCTIASSAGTATVTSTAHGFSTGDRVCIEGADQAAYNIEADITKLTADTFTYAVSFSPASPATGTITCRLVKAPLTWAGGSANFVRAGGGSNAAGATYSTLRSAGVACYTNNQLVIAATPVKDTVLVSDVLDYNTFDPLLKSFRANAGSDDYIVAMHPFAEGEIIVLGRKSIYRAHIEVTSDGTSIDPATSFIELITNEVGCRAKNTVVTAGRYVYFLSDSGVYRLDSNYNDLKVRGMTVPLSYNIADQFADINEAAVGLSSAVWFDNRYWLTVPTGTDTAPNTLLIWSAINEQWESVDRFPTGIHTLLVSDYASRRRLFGVSRAGKLFLMEEREDGDDPADMAVTARVNIPGLLRSRRFSGGDLRTKRFRRVVSGVTLPAGSSVNITLSGYDPDKSLVLGTLSNSASVENGYVARNTARIRSSCADVTYQNAGAGRPVIKAVQIEMGSGVPGDVTRTEN